MRCIPLALLVSTGCVHAPPAQPVDNATALAGLAAGAIVLRTTALLVDDKDPRACVALVAGAAVLTSVRTAVADNLKGFPSVTYDPTLCGPVTGLGEVPASVGVILNATMATTVGVIDAVRDSGRMTCEQHVAGIQGTVWARDVVEAVLGAVEVPNGPQTIAGRVVDVAGCQ